MGVQTAESVEITELTARAARLSPSARLLLARQILDSLVPAVGDEAAEPDAPRGPTAAEIHEMLRMPQPAPDDETIERWIDEHRFEKYGR